MAKAKKEKMEANPFKLKKELPLLPGYIIVILWTAFIFCMIGWIILASLSTTKEIFTGSLLTSGLHFENYTKALFTNKAALNLLNSVIYTVPSCILIIVVCAPAAYCMSRFKFRGAGLVQALIIIGLAIPHIMIVMPLFSVVSALNLSGTHFTLIFLYTACSVPYTTFFLLTFFKGISTSFEEAAAIDGCGPIQCFWKIMFPLAQPAIVTVSILDCLPHGLLSGKSFYQWKNTQAIPLTDTLFDNDSFCLAGLRSKTIGIYEKNSERKIICDISEYPYTLLWSAPTKPMRFICIEPWQSLPAAETDTSEWNEHAAAACIAPNESYSITLHTTFER